MNLFFKYTVVASVAALTLACTSGQNFGPKQLPEPKDAKGNSMGEATTEAGKTTVGAGKTAAALPNWFTKDPEQDGVEGVSADRAYKDLALKTGVAPILVAVIDSGVDVNHEDLKDKIWVNPGEIDGNGIDDDKNGYIDDIHGWNFLGTVKDGKNVHLHDMTLEVTRELVRMKKLKAAKEERGEMLTEAEQAYLTEVDGVVTTGRNDAQEAVNKYSEIKAQLQTQYDILKTELNKAFEDITPAILTAFEAKTPDTIAAKDAMLKILKDNGISGIARLLRVIKANSDYVAFYYNESFDPRAALIGDDVNDFTDHAYGNPDVGGIDPSHGTHVSGIIGANRDNNIGIMGIAQDVRIMAVRAVPNGDEADKDVANAVRYAVDNGARVINMSFGKAYSSVNKHKVDEAFAYAAAHNVVIVHSAGNDAKLDTPLNNFPNKYVKLTPGTTIANWIEVGASAAEKGIALPAFFSNYGKETVDIFAPGYLVESSVPGNKYAVYSGTSMAGPCVAGVAALILSQNQDLTAAQVRDMIRQNARTYPGLMVNKPTEAGNPEQVLFSSLSSTGGTADVLAALRKALIN